MLRLLTNGQQLSIIVPRLSCPQSLQCNRWRPPETARDMCRDTSYAALTFPSLTGINPDLAATRRWLSNLKYVVMWNRIEVLPNS